MRNRIIYLIFVSLFTIGSYGQKVPVKVQKADKNYDNFAYVDAIKTYERVFEKGYKSKEILQNLGNAYYFNADLEKANKWYGELFSFTQDVEPEYYYRYSQTLKGMKDYKKADEMLKQFYEKNGNDLRAKLAESQKNYLEVIKANSGRYTLEDAGVNTEKSDYGSSYFGNKVVFTSARDTGGMTGRKHKWTNESFTNLYSADMGAEGSLSAPERFSKSLNSRFHESTPVFTKDGNTVYFTRNNYLGKKGKDQSGTTLLKIYKATLAGDQWTNIKELPFNSNDFRCAHPALSPDEQTLYFSSDRPGTLGQSDIYKVAITGEDSYGEPENLGNIVNTEGRETFPFITPENELYFASDGHPGLGGLDVFVTQLEEDGNVKNEIINVGEPLNSSKDDFSFLIDNKTKYGYITSNRDGGIGSDDIYKFKELKKLIPKCEQELSGVATDPDTEKAISGAKVTLSDSNLNVIKEVTSEEDGKFNFGKVECGAKYYIKIEKEDRTPIENDVTVSKEGGKTYIPVKVPTKVRKVEVGSKLETVFNIKLIYFDLDKFNVRQDAEVELAKILDVLEQYPTMELDIRSHTDCRQTAKYNEWLSDNRAKSTMAWLVKHGINKKRLKAKGYGESQLVNNCGCEPTNESTCTEEQHQANRRSEFVITKI